MDGADLSEQEEAQLAVHSSRYEVWKRSPYGKRWLAGDCTQLQAAMVQTRCAPC